MKEIFKRNVHTLGDLARAVNDADDEVAFLSGGDADAEDVDIVNTIRLIVYQRTLSDGSLIFTAKVEMPYD